MLVSDSGHHRLLVVDNDWRVMVVVGDGKAGYKVEV